jgi:RHS repeat-associated protein
VLVTTLVQVVTAPSAAAATNPSVSLPTIPSTSVVAPSLRGLDADQASSSQLSGNQNPRQTSPDGHGTTAATSLAPSASWSVSSHTGDFAWSYPLRVPPAPGGLAPNLALSYRSSEVDGRTSATNNQPSWVGEGWSLSPGFVERTYIPCSADDMGNVKPPEEMADLCWRSDNATASYGGSGGVLVRNDGEADDWRAQSDDGSRIERRRGIANGDNDGEHWVITTVDGTQYWFGSETDSKSTWTVPVYGDDDKEPCKGTTLAASHCVQAYRWMLDKVVDRNGNTMRYYYLTESNKYGQNGKDTGVDYIRGGTLDHIDYGMNGTATQPSGRVLFALGDRCVPGSECVESKKDNWPDVTWDNKCSATPCKEKFPSFWSTKRLTSITTQVWRGTAFDDVDRWDLEQQYPDPGDKEKAALWLKSITHNGLVGDGTVKLPSVTFEGTALPNRVDTAADGVAPMHRYRITGVRSESGGLVSVKYTSQCTSGNLPAKAEDNTQWCFPVKWALKNHAERTDYFHKYMVTKVITSDRLLVQDDQKLSSPEQVVSYEYLDGAAWHRDTSEFTKEKDRTYNEFRGFGRVRTRTGGIDDPSGRQIMSEERFYRGMDGDKLPNGPDGKPRFRAVEVEDSEKVRYTDSDWLAGFGFESSSFANEAPTGPSSTDPPRISKTIGKPKTQGPTAARGDIKAYIVRAESQRTYTLTSSGVRVTGMDAAYDDRGLPTETTDLGDVASTTDDSCTKATYARNTGKWILGLAFHVESFAVKCGDTPVFPKDALSDTKNTFDDNGNLKTVQIAKERPATGEPPYVTMSTTDYDAHGRPTNVKDTLNRVTTTAYIPALGGPLTQTKSTTPPLKQDVPGLTTTTSLEPAWGTAVTISDPNQRVTTVAYDPLGRKAKVWLPNQPTAQKPTFAYDYLIRNDGASVVTTTGLGPNKTEITSKVLYDGLVRPRQTQSPAIGGGRLITDTRYDSLGRAWKKTQPYFNDGAVDNTLWLAADASIPSHSRTYYDDAGRPSASAHFEGAFEKSRTTTTYGGDTVSTTPPKGATPITSINDARGQVIEQRRYQGPKPEGAYDAIHYTYTNAGQLETVTDPLGKQWRYTYDFRGRLKQQEDPASGTSKTEYDDANRVTTSTDGRNQTVAFEYDNLGRQIATYAGHIGGTKLTEWTYDTVFKGLGQLASSTRIVNGNKYTKNILSYNQLYQPTSASLTIPDTEGLLAGTYVTNTAYNIDGSLSSQGIPKAGELPQEAVSYKYDNLGPVLESWGGYNGSTFHYGTKTEYTRYGELQRLQLGPKDQHVWQSYYYDTKNRRLMRSIVDAQVASPMQSDTRYTYDQAGTITSLADVPLDQTPDIQCFQQDYLRRTTEAWTTKKENWSEENGCTSAPSLETSGPAPYWHSYEYDKSGNRKTETQHASNGNTIKTYKYEVPGQAHALKSVTTQILGSVSTNEDYDYNASGAVTRKGNQTFEWDVEGQLTKATADGKQSNFVYDAEGFRLIRRDPEGTTLYLGSQELRLNVEGGNPTVTRYYSHGGRIVAVRQGNGSLEWLAGDHQGTSQFSIKAGTLEVTRRRQLPFGGPRGEKKPWPSELGFVGGVDDQSTGLTRMGVRDYDPSTGRFISVDPVMNPGDAQQMNGYTYSNNNPITFSDPSGAYCDSCDFYGRQDEAKGGNGSVWTPAPPGQPNKQNAPSSFSSTHSKAPPPQKPKPPKPPTAKGCTQMASHGYGTQSCAVNPCPPGYVEGSSYNVARCQEAPDVMTAEERHMVLDICGALPIPIVSQACDVGNALGYAIEGDWANAGMSAAGLIPVAGDAATAARAVNSARKAGKACSFTGETRVLMADGSTKPIAEVKVGDKVMAADPQSGETAARVVTYVVVHKDNVLDLVTEDGTRITTTEDHPFWNETDRQWQRADQLGSGDSLVDASGKKVRVRGLAAGTVRIADAYNLTVDDLHTYYVLAETTPVLVHNCKGGVDASGAACSCPSPRQAVWELDAIEHPDTAIHAAEQGGDGMMATVDRPGAKVRRNDNLRGVPTAPKKDRDEFPPAYFLEGKGAHIKLILNTDNRGAGSSMMHQLKDIPDGGRVLIRIVNLKYILGP